MLALAAPRWSAGYSHALVKSANECESPSSKLGDWLSTAPTYTAQQCADACAKVAGCNFFILGTAGSNAGKCYQEHTSSSSCPEGWQSDTYGLQRMCLRSWAQSGSQAVRRIRPDAILFIL